MELDVKTFETLNEHVCDHCRKPINKGRKLVGVTTRIRGYARTDYYHPKCYNVPPKDLKRIAVEKNLTTCLGIQSY